MKIATLTEELELEPIVGSSNLEAFAYYANTSTFFVRFKGGATYAYAEFPERLVFEFRAAESKGKFFHAHIRDKFKGEKVEVEQ